MRRSLTQAAVAAAVTLTLSTPAVHATPRTPLALARQTAHRVGTTLATGTGPISSDNVSLVTTIPGSAAGMRIVGKYAYVTGWAGLTILDVSKPDAPQVVSTLPIAHFENEDVESDGRVVLISNDREQANKGGILYVVDVKDPKAPALASVLSLSQVTSDERGPGHIANCVKDGCRWVWLTGGYRIWVVDLHDIHNPLMVGAFDSPTTAGNSSFGTPGKAGTAPVHDAERDRTGTVWVTGAGGAAAYDVKDPVHPRLLTTTGKQGVDPKVNDFILHNAVRPKGNTLLVTEEDYIDESEVPPGGCRGQGKFQTWDVRGYEHGRTMGLMDQWLTEVEGVPLLNGSKAPLTVNCSSHWFRERNGIAAVGWYEQGLRLLDVRNPRDIKQVGYWLPPNSVAWAAYWLSDDIVYVADTARGIDVLKVTGLGKDPKTVTAPIRASWLGAGTAPLSFLQPSARWGYACLLP
jgi:hypothetical protein